MGILEGAAPAPIAVLSLLSQVTIVLLRDATTRSRVDRTVNTRDLPAAYQETKTLGLGLGPIKDICQKLTIIRDTNLSHPPTSNSGLAHPQIRGMVNTHFVKGLGHRLQFRGMALNRRNKGTSRSQQILDINRDRWVVVCGGNLLTPSSVIIVKDRDTTPKHAPITRDAGKVVMRISQDSMGRTLLN